MKFWWNHGNRPMAIYETSKAGWGLEFLGVKGYILLVDMRCKSFRGRSYYGRGSMLFYWRVKGVLSGVQSIQWAAGHDNPVWWGFKHRDKLKGSLTNSIFNLTITPHVTACQTPQIVGQKMSTGQRRSFPQNRTWHVESWEKVWNSSSDTRFENAKGMEGARVAVVVKNIFGPVPCVAR